MKKNWYRVLAGCCAAILGINLCGCSFLPQEEELPSPPVYKAKEVEYEQVQVMRGDLENRKDISCTYEASVEEKLSFQIADLEIAQVYVSLGDQVEPGQLLAELDSNDLDEQIDAQEETLSSLKIERDQLYESREIARKTEAVELEKIRSDISLGSATQAQYDAKQASNQANEEAYLSQYDYYQAKVAIEEEKMTALKNEKERYRLYAGIKGTVRYLGSSEELSSNVSAFAIISDYSTNRFVCNVTDQSWFSVGDTAQIILSDREIEAEVTAVKDISGDSSEKYEISLQPVVPDPSLQTGDKGKISYLLESSKDTLYLPTDVIQKNSSYAIVYYLDDSGALSTKIVMLGISNDDYTEIKKGVEEGEYVVNNSR